MSKKYPVVIENEGGWSDIMFPDMGSYKMACCDCGLIHEFKMYIYETTPETKSGFKLLERIKRKTYRIGWKVRRDNRATAAHRRGKRNETRI